MKAILYIGPIAGLLGTIVAACSSTPPPVVPDATVAAFCSDWASAYCQLSSICEFDVTSCQTFQTGYCNTFATQAQASGNRTYSQPAGKACIDALTAAFANSPASIPAATLSSLSDTCNLAFVGDQTANNKCASNYDCVTGLVCGSVPGETPACGPLSEKTLGDACADPGDECTGNSYCGPVSGAGPQCLATPALGGQCGGVVTCGTGATCTGGVCVAASPVGGTCATTADCQSGLYCDTYPPAACVTGLTFARGSIDCNGIAGSDEPTGTGADASVTPTPDSSTPDSATTPDTGAEDAATGG